MPRLILASGSPRRRELLESLGIPFEIIVSNADESIDRNADIVSEIERLSYAKALEVFRNNKDAIVIGSDTTVVIGNEVMGKPADKNDAKRMLKLLSGNTHKVITAVSIISAKRSDTFSSVSDVRFIDLSDEEIEEYIATGEPLDKAGSYAIQGIGSKFIECINGDYYAIIGLPISKLYRKLKEYI